MAKTFGIILLGLAAILGGIWLAGSNQQPGPKPITSPAGLGGDFTLQGADGPVSLSDFRGKVVILAYGYTSCPDVCPLTLSNITLALNSLTPAQQAQVAALFVTLDPERDTPAKTAEYASHFHPNIVGLSGTPAQIAQVAKQYLVIYRKVPMPESALGYVLDHSSRMYVLDKQGNYSDSASHTSSPQELAAMIVTALSR